MKKVKKLTAFLVSAMMLMVNSTGFAEYPEGVVKENGDGTTSYIYGPWAPENQPTSAITGTYPTKLHNQYGDGNSPFTNKWHTDGVVKTYSNPEKRFVVGGKNFILLDTDANGNYFVIADDLYGTKGYVTVAKETTTTSNYFQALLNGTWTYDPQNQYSVAKWLNNGFLTDGNRGEKLPEEIITNLVEKEWGVEGGSQIEDSWCYSQVGLTAPKYTSIAPYKVTQKVSLLSAYEYNKYWSDISPLVFGADPNTNGTWNYKHWMLRTPSNNKITDAGGGKNSIYINTKTGILSANAPYNETGIRPCFWLEKDFFKTVKLDKLDKNATYVMAEIGKNSVPELISLYGLDALKAAGYSFDAELNPKNVYIKGQAVAGNVIEAMATTSAESVSYAWLHSDTKSGEYEIVAYGNTLTVLNKYDGFMKVMAVAKDQDVYSEPSYSPIFEVSVLGNVVTGDHPDTETWPLDTPETEKFYIDGVSSDMNEWIVLDKVYGDDGKAQLFIYSDLAQGTSTWDATNLSQKYDTSIPGTLANKLETNVFSSSDIRRNIDAGMLNAAKVHNWRTEAGHTEVYPNDFFITSKLVPLSAWEYSVYHDKIGAQPDFVTGGQVTTGSWLRTPGYSEKAKGTFMQIKNSKSYTSETAITATWALASRPAMYLGIDFFANNKIVVDKIAANASIYNELKKYFSYEDLYDLYTVDELSKIGVVSNEMIPSANGVKINGVLTVGSVVEADYDFDGTEGASKYQWYAMGASGVYEAISGATSKTYTLTSNEMGREILVEVIPVNENGVAGLAKTAYTKAVVQSELLDEAVATATMSGKTVNAKFTIKSSIDTTYEAIIAIYTDDNVLVDVYTELVEVKKGENEYPVNYTTLLSGGTNCKAMLWTDIDNLEPVCDFATAKILN